jgi:hypothetical protein
VQPPSVDGPLREAILGLLAKDPDERMDFRTCRALLTKAAADRSTSATPVPSAAAGSLDRAGRTEALAPVESTGPGPEREVPPARYETREYAGSRGRPSGPLVAALLVALLLIAGLVWLAVAADDEGNQQADAPKDSPTSSAPQETPSSPAETSQESSPPPTTDEGQAPAGFTTYEDPSGFSVAVPEGWQAEQVSPTAVDIKEQGGTRFLRIDQTDTPKDDPQKDWERQEKRVQNELPNYQRIRIDEVDYNGWPAADWEFTFGDNTHVLNRGFVPSEDTGYALYLSTPEEQWADSQGIFQTAADTFQPAG